METKALSHRCSMQCLDQVPEPLPAVEVVWQSRHRVKRIMKRRLNYLANWFAEKTGRRRPASAVLMAATGGGLQAGDLVRVKSREEIQATLNRWNRLKGCDIMEEMWLYCGTTQRVLKRVERFLDERDYRMKRCRGIVFLEGLTCEGTFDYGRCDRTCYYFWREEWLEKVG
jgi:hypothetical protein